MSHQYCALEDTVYFGFAANLTSGAGGDGATPLFDVRLGGAAASAAPVLSGTPTLLTHVNYLDGCYEVAVAATAANGFAAGNTYLVFTTLTIDGVTPGACVGSFRIAPVPADVRQWLGTAPATPTVAGVPEVDVTHLLGTGWLPPAVAGTPDVNVKQISGDQMAADNAELMFDGTGYAGGTIKLGVDTVAISGDTVAADNLETAADGGSFNLGGGGVVAASVTGAVGSVTGAVGSVTGNVGGNVAGSVNSVTNRVTANTDQLGGDAQSATDLKDFADAGYDPATNKVEGVKLADTLTTYTGNTPQTGDAFARLGAPAGASVSVDVAAVKTDTGNLISRLGAWTGSGLNTVLGALRAIAAKAAALTPTDLSTGTTFDNTTDSNEAIRDRGDAAWTTGTTPPTAIENADALLKRDWTAVTGEASRSALNALRFVRNKWSVSGTTLTVTKEDDTATAWTGAVTVNAAADPITGNDPS